MERHAMTTPAAPAASDVHPVTPAAAPAAPATEPAQPAGSPLTAAPADESPEQQIERLQAEVKKALATAKAAEDKARVNAKTAAAEEAKAELAQTIGKALGLVADEPIDPAKLTEQVSTATAEAKQAKVELAVFHAAAAAGADATALLDSRTFMAKLATVDPSDTAAVTAAITEAVKANAAFAAATTPRVPAPNPALGSSASGAPDLDAQIAAAQKAGDVRAVIHLQNLKLTQPQSQ